MFFDLEGSHVSCSAFILTIINLNLMQNFIFKNIFNSRSLSKSLYKTETNIFIKDEALPRSNKRQLNVLHKLNK